MNSKIISNTSSSVYQLSTINDQLFSVGLYLHIPFCIRRCGYCAFATQANTDVDAQGHYADALLKEMGAWAGKLKVRTVFFGGGTPSLLRVEEIDRICNAVRDLYEVEPGAEWTMETHPVTAMGDKGKAKLKAMKEAGINRVSFGIESFNAVSLHRLERAYHERDIRDLMDTCRKLGLTNINLDIILGWPWENFGDFKRTLNIAASLDTPHLSLYPLSIEEGTPFSAGQVKINSDDQAAQYMHAHDYLNSKGYEHYEIANYAKPGYEARHNLIYWHYEDYLGLGLAAASKIGDRAFTNTRNHQDYLKNPTHSSITEPMTPQEHTRRQFIMKLRLNNGVTTQDFEAKLPESLRVQFNEGGHLIQKNGQVSLAPSGWLLSNKLFSEVA